MLVAKDHQKNVDVEPIYYQTSRFQIVIQKGIENILQFVWHGHVPFLYVEIKQKRINVPSFEQKSKGQLL